MQISDLINLSLDPTIQASGFSIRLSEFLQMKIGSSNEVTFTDFENFLIDFYHEDTSLWLSPSERASIGDNDIELFTYCFLMSPPPFVPMSLMSTLPMIPFAPPYMQPMPEVTSPPLYTNSLPEDLPETTQSLPTFLTKSMAEDWVKKFRKTLISKDDLRIAETWESGNHTVWAYFCGALCYFSDSTMTICKISQKECTQNFLDVLGTSYYVLKKMCSKYTHELVARILPVSFDPLEINKQIVLLDAVVQSKSDIVVDFIGTVQNIKLLETYLYLKKISDSPDTQLINLLQSKIKKEQYAAEKKASKKAARKRLEEEQKLTSHVPHPESYKKKREALNEYRANLNQYPTGQPGPHENKREAPTEFSQPLEQKPNHQSLCPCFTKVQADEWVKKFTFLLKIKNRDDIASAWSTADATFQAYFCGKSVVFGGKEAKIKIQNRINNFDDALLSKYEPVIESIWQCDTNGLIRHITASLQPTAQIQLLAKVDQSNSSIVDQYIKTVLHSNVLEHYLSQARDTTKKADLIQKRIESLKATRAKAATGKSWNANSPKEEEAALWIIDFKEALSKNDDELMQATWKRARNAYWNYFIGKITQFKEGLFKIDIKDSLHHFLLLLDSRHEEMIRKMWAMRRGELAGFIQTMDADKQEQILDKVILNNSAIIQDYVTSINHLGMLEEYLKNIKEENIPDSQVNCVYSILEKRLLILKQPIQSQTTQTTEQKSTCSTSVASAAAARKMKSTSKLLSPPPKLKKSPESSLPKTTTSEELTFSVNARSRKTELPSQKKRPSSHLTPLSTRKNAKTTIPVKGTNTWIQYAEYKTQLLLIKNKRIKERVKYKHPKEKAAALTIFRCNELFQFVQNPMLFQHNVSTKSYSTWLTWTNEKNLLLDVALLKENQLHICFRSSEKDNVGDLLLEITIEFHKNEVVITEHEPKEPWNRNDLDDMANDFYALLPDATFQHTPFLTDMAGKKAKMNPDEFSEVITYYKNQNITTRLQKIFISPGGPYVFGLTWNDVTLKITVENAPFASYVLSEQELFKRHYPNDTFSPRYYRIKILEGTVTILELWSTLEALVLEVYKVHSGKSIAGSEAIKILNKFLQLIQPQNYYLQDLANLTITKPDSGKKGSSIVLPLRVIKMLTTGKTWYENHLPVRPMNATNWGSGWNKCVTLSQSADAFYDAAKALRLIPFEELLTKWTADDAAWLRAVAKKYYADKAPAELIGQDIFAVIFDKKNMADPAGYADLEKLYTLLELKSVLVDIATEDNKKTPVHMTNKIQKSAEIKDAKHIVLLCRSVGYTRFFEHRRAAAPEEKTCNPTEAPPKV